MIGPTPGTRVSRRQTSPSRDGGQAGEAVALDMTDWTPALRTHLGRVTKAHIVAAVLEAVGGEAEGSHRLHEEAADVGSRRAVSCGSGWLPPPLLRTEQPAWADEPQAETDADADPETARLVRTLMPKMAARM